MKILVDPEIFFYGRCGMVRYYTRLFAELRRLGMEMEIPLKIAGSDMIKGNREYLKKFTKLLPLGRKRIRRYFERAAKKDYYNKVKNGNYDILFITSPVFEDTFLKYLPTGKPFVMVVHDTMQCVLGLDSFYDPAGSNGDKLAFLSRRAARVFCISNQVQDDLINLSTVNKNKTTIIYTGNLLDTKAEQYPDPKLPDNYILFVGERTGRKNFRSFIQAIATYLKENPELLVVCTGTCNPWEKDLFLWLGIEKQITFYDAPDALLVHLYKNARCLVYPSLYEGFGLPVLEAMALGCPVISSATGAIAEVAGEAAYYVNPHDKESMRQGLLQLLTNQNLSKSLVQKGLERSKLFEITAMTSSFKNNLEAILNPD